MSDSESELRVGDATLSDEDKRTIQRQIDERKRRLEWEDRVKTVLFWLFMLVLAVLTFFPGSCGGGYVIPW